MASSSTAAAVSLKTLNLASVPILTGGSNFKKWRREIKLLLTLNEFEIAIDNPQPPLLTDKCSKAEKAEHERWWRSNKLALSILEAGMTDHVKGGIKQHDLAVEYFKAIEGKFQERQKAEIGHHMSLLTTYKCEGNGSIGDHILKLSDAAEKLNSMDVHISETQLVFMVLQALPAKYCQLKVSYNTQGNLWTLDELIAQCVQEERRLKQHKGKEIEAVNLVHASKGKSKKGGGFNPSKNS